MEAFDLLVLLFLVAGWDRNFNFQLYHSDPSGNYSGWHATAIGANNQAAQSILKTDYKEGMELRDALKLAVKVLSKTMDSTALNAEKLEFATLTLKNGKTHFHIFVEKEIDDLVKECDLSVKEDEELEGK